MSELKLAQIADYDIQTADCFVAFRYFRRKVKGIEAFVWLSLEQEKAVRFWWAEHGDGNPLEEMAFSIRKNQLPKELHFWPTPILGKGEYITESQGLMGCEVSPDPPPDQTCQTSETL